MIDIKPDEKLMLAYAQGDIKAFDELYNRHKDSLYRYLLRQISNKDLANDLYQELWGRIIRTSATYSADAKWTTWAYRIAHNLVIDHYRTFKSHDDIEEQELESVNSSPDRAHVNNDLSKRLKHCMTKLPAVQLETFILSQESDLTLKMIAEVVDASHEAVKTRLRYARTALQKCLEAFGIDPTHNREGQS